MSSRARSKGATLVVVLIPQRIQALLLGRPAEFPELDPFAFSRRIREACHPLGIPVIDVLESLKAGDRPTSFYYPLDGHLTPPGQQRLGRFLAAEMLRKGLVR